MALLPHDSQRRRSLLRRPSTATSARLEALTPELPILQETVPLRVTARRAWERSLSRRPLTMTRTLNAVIRTKILLLQHEPTTGPNSPDQGGDHELHDPESPLTTCQDMTSEPPPHSQDPIPHIQEPAQDAVDPHVSHWVACKSHPSEGNSSLLSDPDHSRGDGMSFDDCDILEEEAGEDQRPRRVRGPPTVFREAIPIGSVTFSPTDVPVGLAF